MTVSSAEALSEVRSKIEKAARLAKREPSSVELIAVSKTQGAEAILPLIESGQRIFGENRVQEAESKWPALLEQYPDIRLHLVGQLQSNKAGDAVRLFDAIHSVYRPSLVTALASAIEKEGRRPDLFIQVNIGAEAQKGGCAIEALPALLDHCEKVGLVIRGLMCVPPVGVEPAPYFALLRKLAGRHDLARLSMGMSSDFETAVTIGATHVRIGSALFGERP